MKATIIFPRGKYFGNLLWHAAEIATFRMQLSYSLESLRERGYWAGPYPEGDGIAFCADKGQNHGQILQDFRETFPWLEIGVGTTSSFNEELACSECVAKSMHEVECVVIVPLERIHYEESFDLGQYRFYCAKQFEPGDERRYSEHLGPYLQFRKSFKYAELLRLNDTVTGDEQAISTCLTVAEHAMDVIRLEFSSFIKPEFTPNPAGQLDDGFYAVEIIPTVTHIKPLSLVGIARPMSVSNNWLGPEINPSESVMGEFLSDILNGRSDEMAICVKSALRGCRASFYSLGEEAKFLNLVFTLDGLTHPKKNWTGWTHRTYISALASNGSLAKFSETLTQFDKLYEVRNSLVHKGLDFYEIDYNPRACCEDLLNYIKAVIRTIALNGIETIAALHCLAEGWLGQSEWKIKLSADITTICTMKSVQVSGIPKW